MSNKQVINPFDPLGKLDVDKDRILMKPEGQRAVNVEVATQALKQMLAKDKEHQELISKLIKK